jgi:D-lactate dehydrogenase (cytochrome)
MASSNATLRDNINTIPGDLASALSDRIGAGKVSTGSSILVHHAHDGGMIPMHMPDVVVFPESTTDVADVIGLAAERRIPVTPFGAGTSKGGKTIPAEGGISLDLTRMDAIIAVHPEDFNVVVQPGVLRKALNVRLAEHGLFFPVDPGADASLGGMASTNASGTTTVRYGGMHPNVLALEAVLADGSIVRTGTKARKSSAGYDLTNLLIGAEGTLGVITELTLAVYAIPERVAVARVSFAEVESATKAVVALTGLTSTVSRVELLDGPTLAIVNAHFGTQLRAAPTLFVEYGGSPHAIEDDITLTRDVCRDLGSVDIVVEHDPTAMHRLWEARHNLGHALHARNPGKTSFGTDICVPISELPAAVANGRRLIEARGLDAALVAHAGDGNFHFVFMLDPASDDHAAAKEIYTEMIERALACGGTCSAEHGIGMEKQSFLVREHGDLIPAMRAIKAALDPAGIMNPGKIFASTEAG